MRHLLLGLLLAADGGTPCVAGWSDPSCTATWTTGWAMDTGDRIFDARGLEGATLGYLETHADGGYLFRVVDARAVRVEMPDGGVCR